MNDAPFVRVFIEEGFRLADLIGDVNVFSVHDEPEPPVFDLHRVDEGIGVQNGFCPVAGVPDLKVSAPAEERGLRSISHHTDCQDQNYRGDQREQAMPPDRYGVPGFRNELFCFIML